MTFLIAIALVTGVIAILIGLAVFRLRNHPFSLERFRPQLEEILSDGIAPLHATVGNLSATRLRWSGIEITARNIRLLSDDGHIWVYFNQITSCVPLSAILSPRSLETFTGPWLFSETMVDALSPQSPFEGLHGIATNTDVGLRFDVAGGRFGRTNIDSGKILISEVRGKNESRTRAEISFHAKTTASDALNILSKTPFELMEPEALPAGPVQGEVEADIGLNFAFDELPQMMHNTRAEVRDLRLPNAIGGLDLSKGFFDITVSNDTATVEGTARLGGVPATLRYSTPAKPKPETLVMQSADIGALIAAANISGRLDGGSLAMRLERSHDDEPWSGLVEVGTTRVLQAPLLTRLLTMASLPGFLSLLSSDGLTIDHARTEIAIESGRISCRSIRISIDQLEITGHVNIALDSGHIEGEGLLIPAASLQRLVSTVPILGAFLEGIGKKNTPIVATRFTLSGPPSNPEITVFPVSSLAPDILRDLGLV